MSLGVRVILDTSGEPLKLALNVSARLREAESGRSRMVERERDRRRASGGRALKTILAAGAKEGAISLGAKGLVWRSAQCGKWTLCECAGRDGAIVGGQRRCHAGGICFRGE